MPLLELIAGSLDKGLYFPSEGELLQLRFDGTGGSKNTNTKLVYASFHPVP
jgi:hypothetical protein